MKVLITGSAGFVGKKLCERLKLKHEIFGISRRKSPTTTLVLDLTSQQTEKVLGELNPDVIIHCAALTNVDYCETHQDESYKNNVYATKNLVEWANKNNKKIIYISTDYVYSGQTNNYDEKSETNPLNIYGKTKLEAENIVRTLPLHAILRTTVVFGYDPGGLNFLMQLLNLTGPRKIPKDQISNPTDIAVLGDYIEHILNKNINGLYVATYQHRSIDSISHVLSQTFLT